jgi:hypothetical protein
MALVATQAISTSKVVNSIGVNTHFDAYAHGYENLTTSISAINYLGIKNLRDSPNHSTTLGPNGLWQKVANGTGAKFDAFMNRSSPASNVQALENTKKLAAQGIINYIEGTNEGDTQPALDAGMTIAWAKNFQIQVYNTGKALGIPVINMSFGAGWTAADGWKGNYDSVGDLSHITDYANAHTYVGSNAYTDPTMERLNGLAKLAAASRPVITTEIGWDLRTTSAIDVARFSLQAVLDGIENGNVKTYFYSLYDDTSGKWGLMNADGSARPAGTALHNLTTILADTGAPRNGTLTYGLTGATANDHKLLMQKSSGVFQLALWNERDAAHTITVNLGSAAQTVRIYNPLNSAAPIATYSNTANISVTIPTSPIIVEIVPGSSAPPTESPTPPPAPTPTPSTAPVVYGKSEDDIYITGGTHSVYLLGNDGSITATAGTNTMYTNGTRNHLNGGTGVERIQAFAGGNVLNGGGGNDTVYFGGSNNVIYTGDDADVLHSSGTNSRIVFGKAGEGVTDIYGYVLKNGDTLDLRTTLAATTWTKDVTKLSDYLKITMSGNTAVLSVDTDGTGAGAAQTLAMFRDSGNVTLSTLLTKSLVA